MRPAASTTPSSSSSALPPSASSASFETSSSTSSLIQTLPSSSSSSSSTPLSSSSVIATSTPSQVKVLNNSEDASESKSFLQPGNKFFPLAVVIFIAAVFLCCMIVIFLVKRCCHSRRFADPRDYQWGAEKGHSSSQEDLIASPSSSTCDSFDEKSFGMAWHEVDQGMRMRLPIDDDTPLGLAAPQARARLSSESLTQPRTQSIILPPTTAVLSSPINHHPTPELDLRVLHPPPQAVAMNPRRASLPSQLMPRAGTPPPQAPKFVPQRPRSFSHPAPPLPPKAATPAPRQGSTTNEATRISSSHLKYQPTRPSSLRYSVNSDESDSDDSEESLSFPRPPPARMFQEDVAGPQRMGAAKVRVLG
ncbi:hypothetical protein OIO90_000464 [Microbotryomycetes sp. JL221]|nr:hypothetical protein OIO90_000464 [Microbotryomycetes sp. JL221]